MSVTTFMETEIETTLPSKRLLPTLIGKMCATEEEDGVGVVECVVSGLAIFAVPNLQMLPHLDQLLPLVFSPLHRRKLRRSLTVPHFMFADQGFF